MSKAQIYLGVDLLDFTGVINVKRQVKDYRDPAIGASNKSYTLDIPLTPSNQMLLKYVNDIRSREEVTDTARIVVDSIEVIKGKLRILSSTSLIVKAIIEADDWVDDISGASIKDISWEGGDEHDFTSANIVASWSAAAGALYRYPLINFSQLISEDYGSGGSDVYSYEFYPMWNIEDIVTKLLLDSGYTLAGSGFFAGAFGRALYLLSAPVPNSDDFLTGKGLSVYVDGSTDNYDSVSVPGGNNNSVQVNKVMRIEGEATDEGNDFSIGTYRYTAPATGTYRFKSQIKLQCSANVAASSWLISAQSIVYSIRKNGTPLETYSDTETNPPEPTIFASGNVFNLDTGYVHLEASDYIDIHINVSCAAANTTGGALTLDLFVIHGLTTSYLEADWSEQNLWPGIGKTMSPTDYLPNIDGLDFLKGLKEAFNLRFWMDRNNRTMYIETSDDFYGSTVIDWTDKIDYSVEIEMDVLASSYRKTQRFRWKPDTTDKAYVNEVSANGIPLQKVLVLDSEYVKPGVTEHENAFLSPSILGAMPQIGHWGSQLVPRIFGSGEFVSSSRPYPATRAKSWQPRIFEWKGLVSLGSGNFDYYEDFEDASATNYTTFPSAVTPDMSDMYDAYFLKDWNRIEKNKIAKCVLKLSPAEIIQFGTVVGTAANEGFRATYKLNIEGIDMYFIVNKNTTDGDRVKCEFVQKM